MKVLFSRALEARTHNLQHFRESRGGGYPPELFVKVLFSRALEAQTHLRGPIYSFFSETPLEKVFFPRGLAVFVR